MHRSLAAYHRLLEIACHRYDAADRALALTLRDMRAAFPPDSRPHPGTIGSRGSALRRRHDQREEALLRLDAAREKFIAARARMHRPRARRPDILLLAMQIDRPG